MIKSEPSTWVTSERSLRKCIAAPAAPVLRKIQQQLEDTARTWIAASSLVALAVKSEENALIDILLRASPTELAFAPDAHHVWINNDTRVSAGAWPCGVDSSSKAGTLFLLAGIDSTVRANGTLRLDTERDDLVLAVDESFMHCPKAFIRSEFWHVSEDSRSDSFVAESGTGLGEQSLIFLTQAPFAFLATSSEEGQVDLSPRGDPPGFVRVIDENTLLLPDRPGNRIADSFRNVLSHPYVTLLLLIPGSAWTLQVQARARITTEALWLAKSAVKGKIPKIGLWLDVTGVHLSCSQVLVDSGVWDPQHHREKKTLPSVGRALIQQIEPKGRFLGLKSKVLDWALHRDAKKNLY